MKIILSGRALSEFETKTVEIGGKPMLRILGPMRLDTGETLPVTVWGDTKGNYWKQFAANGEPFSIVAELQAKPQTFTNHEGETVTVPNLQIKLYSYLNMPTNVAQYYRNAPITTPPPQPPQPQTAEKVKPWNVADTPGLEGIL